ncbi:MAG: hypothetical protein L0211_27120 [Planctomycetaceae bacterium]|nr:hypothetical protein [Planctomycetaceae bacterium]
MNRFTVTWKPEAKARLAAMWNSNPAIRADISRASDEADRLLAIDPENLGMALSAYSRVWSVLPIKVLDRLLLHEGQFLSAIIQ